MIRICVLYNSRAARASVKMLLETGVGVVLCVPIENQTEVLYARLLAKEYSVECIFPSKSSCNDDIVSSCRQHGVNLLFIITFPYILKPKCFTSLQLGAYNFHPGPLPSYRGADPIFWQLRHGHIHGEVTCHKVEAELDAGAILLREPLEFDEIDTYGSYLARLEIAFCNTTKKAILIFANALRNQKTVALENQNCEAAQYLPMPNFQDIRIMWHRDSALDIQRLVRASNGRFEGAIAEFRGMPLYILETELDAPVSSSVRNLCFGEIVDVEKGSRLTCMCRDHNPLKIAVVKYEGSVYSSSRFVEAYGVSCGEVLS